MENDRKIGNTYLNRYPPARASTAAAETSERRDKSETLTQRSLGASLSTVDGLPDINYFDTAHREKPEVHEFFQLPFLFGNLPTPCHGQRRRKGRRRIPWTRFGRRFFITHPLFRRFQGFKVGKYSRFQLGLYNNLGDANKTSTKTNAREDDLKINIGVDGDTHSLNSAGNTSQSEDREGSDGDDAHSTGNTAATNNDGDATPSNIAKDIPAHQLSESTIRRNGH